MFRRTRFIHALGLVTAIGSAAALAFLADGSAMASVSTSQPSAKAAHQPRISGLRLKEIHVPATRLAPNMRARYFSGRSASATVAAYAFVDYADGQCLNANNQGPSAGQNGDAVAPLYLAYLSHAWCLDAVVLGRRCPWKCTVVPGSGLEGHG